MSKIIIEYFPQAYQDLNRELVNHPKLLELLAKHPANEFEVRLSEIAAYCDVILDGQYFPSELEKLAEILVKKLVEKRVPVILSSF